MLLMSAGMSAVHLYLENGKTHRAEGIYFLQKKMKKRRKKEEKKTPHQA